MKYTAKVAIWVGVQRKARYPDTAEAVNGMNRKDLFRKMNFIIPQNYKYCI